MASVSRVVAFASALTALLVAPAWAGAAVLYDQTDNQGAAATVYTQPNFSPSNDWGGGEGDRTADDFTVPAGQSWTINEIDVAGAFMGSPGETVNVYIYTDASGHPGTELLNESSVATGGPNYAVPVAFAPALEPGHYWLTVQLKGADQFTYWAWTTRTVQSGDPAQWVANHNVNQTCVAHDVWAARTACYSGSNPDQVFSIKGTDGTSPPPPPDNAITLGKPKLNKKKGTATEPVTVPGPGELSLTGASVASQRRARPMASKPVTAAGTVDLLVKPKGKTKKKLKKAGKAKAKLTITFTPTGGTANVQTTTIKLKKKLR